MSESKVLTAERVYQHKLTRFNPLRSLTPASLSTAIDQFRVGYLRNFAILADTMLERDDMLISVEPKRRKDVSRLNYEITTIDCGADETKKKRAEEHKERLEYFYNNLKSYEALDGDSRGGYRHLIRTMMHAVGAKKAVHEIVWKPGTDDGQHVLTASFTYIPLWFFEHRTSRLRFLPTDTATEGDPLEDDGWMITTGDGINVASAIAYMFKHLPLKDWLNYSERFGLPYVIGKTSSAKGSDGWEAMKTAVEGLAGDGAAVMNVAEAIELLTASAQGQMPQSVLVERMDRVMATMWRGGDLSTISKGNDAVGSNPQESEMNIFVEDDAGMISETFQQWVDPVVIRYFFGDEAPLAYFELMPPKKENIEIEIKKDEFLLKNGAQLSMHETLERYQRSPAEEGEEILGGSSENPAEPDAPQGAQETQIERPAEALGNTADDLGEALGVPLKWLQPIHELLDEMEEVIDDPDHSDEEVLDLLEEMADRVPDLISRMDIEALAEVFERGMGGAALDGVREKVSLKRSRISNASPLQWIWNCFSNAGTSAGAKKGWATRKARGWTPQQANRGRGRLSRADKLAFLEIDIAQASRLEEQAMSLLNESGDMGAFRKVMGKLDEIHGQLADEVTKALRNPRYKKGTGLKKAIVDDSVVRGQNLLGDTNKSRATRRINREKRKLANAMSEGVDDVYRNLPTKTAKNIGQVPEVRMVTHQELKGSASAYDPASGTILVSNSLANNKSAVRAVVAYNAMQHVATKAPAETKAALRNHFDQVTKNSQWKTGKYGEESSYRRSKSFWSDYQGSVPRKVTVDRKTKVEMGERMGEWRGVRMAAASASLLQPGNERQLSRVLRKPEQRRTFFASLEVF